MIQALMSHHPDAMICLDIVVNPLTLSYLV